MRLRESSAISLLIPLVLCVVLAGLMAGCGGGGSDQSSNGGGDQEQKQKGEAAKKEPLQKKIAIGTVKGFHEDKRRISLRPTVKAQSEGPLAFKIRKNATITMGGKKAELGDIKEGQQAQIEYVVQNEVNRAVVVHLFEANSQNSGEGEKTG
ncbi:MAG TPA: hypothetical protein VFI90_14435 [Rubrobacter sp.]|nr:hypothetical protein [Rubrobacter sp.]